ncbi:MAG: alpha/beta hydrolase [Vicinamibacterales bacterium]
MIPHTIQTPTHGRYLVDAPAGSGPFPVLMGFHGYAQSAAVLMPDLARLDPDHAWLRVSVQGLHRFYSRMQDVVASWMTREDRTLAMADNLAYVGSVRQAVAGAYPAAPAYVVVGFSQGVAQAYRTALAFGDACRGVIALGGDVPPDVAPSASRLPPVLVGRGTRDSWYPADRLAADLACLREAGTDVTACEFDGGHDWDDRFVAAAAAWLAGRHRA